MSGSEWIVIILLAALLVAGWKLFRSRKILFTANQQDINSVSNEDNGIEDLELRIGPTPEQPILSISKFAISDQEILNSGRVLDPKTTTISRLSPFLNALPSIGTSIAVSQGNYMQVIVNGPLASAVDGQSLLPFVRGADGKIKALARLKDAGALSNLVNAAALFQVASVIVAQKHLADISKKLDEIKAGVDRISAFQTNKRRGTINSSLDYLNQQGAPTVMKGELSVSIRNECDALEGKLRDIQEHLRIDIEKNIDAIKSIKDPDNLGSKGLQHEILKHQKSLSDLYKEWFLCTRARAAAWQIISAFPGEPNLKHNRKAAILKTIDDMISQNGPLARGGEEMRQKIQRFNAIMNLGSTIRKRKEELNIWLQTDIPEFWAEPNRIKQVINEVDRMLIDQQTPLRLALKIENGEVVEAIELPN